MPNVSITNHTFASGLIANLGSTFGAVGYLAQNISAGSFSNSVFAGTGGDQFVHVAGSAVSNTSNTISLVGGDSRVTVTESGSVSNGSSTNVAAVKVHGSYTSITNFGDISGATGVEIDTRFGVGGSRLVNHGAISGSGLGIAGDGSTLDPHQYGVGVLIEANGGFDIGTDLPVYIINSGTISGSPFDGVGTQYSIRMEATFFSDDNFDHVISDTAAHIFNSGTLIGNVRLLSQADTIANTGTIIGDTDMGRGNDLFDNRGGIVHGTIATNDGNDTVYGGSNDDFVSAGNNNDRVIAFDGDDEIYGGSGADTLRGGGGDDLIYGGDDDDDIHGGSSDDLIYGGSGEDSIDAASGNDSVYGGNDDDRIIGNAGNDRLEGDDGDDSLFGGTGEDFIRGNSGDDVLEGGLGNDILSGGTNNDTLRGETGDDFVFGGSNNDKLYGGSGNDYLAGGANDDTIFGGSDDDILIGGTGKDLLTGGIGADVFMFGSQSESIHGSNRDTITDFQIGVDQIDLSGIMPDLTFVTSYSNTAGEVRYNSAIGRLYIDTDGNGASDFSINFDGNPALSASDLIL